MRLTSVFFLLLVIVAYAGITDGKSLVKGAGEALQKTKDAMGKFGKTIKKKFSKKEKKNDDASANEA
ncbi:hypothetical protein GCK32_021700 [Trichostrongylus colubriformis]|uniref:Uncharacterized protein n=1 Tax=Trichostrongylus colubriformis TaxID=6319 RepID=A0AAN8F7X5_TRICO